MPSESDTSSGETGAGIGMDDEAFLYLCNMIHRGYYNIRITWGEVRDALSFSVNSDLYAICSRLRTHGFIGSFEDADPFMIFGPVSVHPPNEESLISSLIERIAGNPLVSNVAMIGHLQRSLIIGIIDSFYDHELSFASTPEERVLLSAVTSDEFAANQTASGILDGMVSLAGAEKEGMEQYTEQPWFNELLLIIKNGYYGNGSFNFIDTLEKPYRVEFTAGILEIIQNGCLLWIILNFREFIRKAHVDRSLKKFVRKRHQEVRLGGFYDWLSIGNDFAVGVEFLVGSIEFLPGYDSTFGVYLFIIGSTQLLIRPVITLARKLHLRKLIKRKIEF